MDDEKKKIKHWGGGIIHESWNKQNTIIELDMMPSLALSPQYDLVCQNIAQSPNKKQQQQRWRGQVIIWIHRLWNQLEKQHKKHQITKYNN